MVLLLPSQAVKLGSRRGPVLSPTVLAVAVPVSVVPDKQGILRLQEKHPKKITKTKKSKKIPPIPPFTLHAEGVVAFQRCGICGVSCGGRKALSPVCRWPKGCLETVWWLAWGAAGAPIHVGHINVCGRAAAGDCSSRTPSVLLPAIS